ncbi:TonB-dependent receptor domain-containing protein [Granulicella cerasi]|uniref:TonB-dependent receptor domain-containing protein n=1 Tax=Granulicella cerasi TaxID=741063 RepID=A0ABW1Z8C1_9BACT|nr:TonB-dependent receptor [Granulicella cerasi]
MKAMFRNFRYLAACTAVAASLSLPAFSQSMTQGGISGTVFDATDAAVPGATVLIHNNATGAESKLTTSGSGAYSAPLLPPGSYTVTISANGFTTQKRTDVVVLVNQITEVQPHLTTGGSAETVEVSAEIPTINFDSPAFGGHLETKEIEAIPINNRRWSSLALTTPGVTNDASGFGLLSFRAIPAVLNNVQIDGTDDNQAFFSEERGRTRAGYSTAQVAVREFQVNTGVYSAELGRAVGGVVNSVTKSGGNQLHGEVYFEHRGDEFSSLNPNVKLTTQNSTGAYVSNPFRPKDKRNQYGFGVGGPLIKDKLFWFYAFDAFRRNFPGVAVPANPSQFYNTCTPTYATANATFITNLAAALGTTTTAAQAACATALTDLSTDLGIVPRFGNQLINTPKLTWQINNKNVLNVLYHRLRWDSPGGVQTQAALAYARDAFGTDFVKLDYGVAILDSQISSRMTNELRYQYARELNDEGQQPYTTYSANHLMAANGVATYANIYAGSYGFYAGSPYYSYRTAYPDERKWQIGDTASYTLGRHTIRFGVDFVHNYDLQNTLYQGNGSYTYGSVFNYIADIVKPTGACLSSTGATPTISATGTFGCYSNQSQEFGPTTFDLATLDTAYFVQDDWKVSSNLTLNLGVRYDYEMLPSPYKALQTASQTASFPSDKNNVSARLGFAWDPFSQGKTVVRGGFGMYYGRIPNAVIMNAYITTGSTAGQSAYTTYNSSAVTNSSGTANLRFPQVLTAAPAASASAPSIQYLDSHMQNPYTEQFDLQLQQDLGKHNVLSISYIGALGRELPNYLNLNLNPSNYYNTTYTVNCGTGVTTCNGVASGTTFTNRVYSNRSVGNVYNTVNPSFNAITDVISNANSAYHGMSVDITNRSWKFITFDANYTWAHALDYNVAQFTGAGTNNWIDPYANGRSNYGNSSLNIRHRVVGWANINLPGISHQNYLSYLTNGWSVKPLVQMQSGLPYSYGVSGTPQNQCAATTCLAPYSSGVGGTGVTSYIPYFGRNTLYAPRAIVVDARVQKDFRLREGMSLQLLAEGFNLANHQNVTGINTTAFTFNSGTNTLAPNTNFGTPSTSGVNSNYAYQVRQVQLGARVTF